MANFTMVDFNYFDITIGAIVLILGIKGFMNGFIKEIFGLAGLVAGVYFGSRFADTAAAFINDNFLQMQNPTLLKLFGFLAVLIIVWLGATLLGSILSKLTSVSGLSFIDRLFGFIAGGGKYFIIFALIVTALSNVTLVKENLGKYVKHSVLYPYLIKTGSAIIHLDPAALGLGEQSKADILKKAAGLKPPQKHTEHNKTAEGNISSATAE
ncbi:CvpA family protein [Sulfurovum sp.]|uniref:CvpA family protein n=1 Tax=Sulfurovum sp. TaxID=1969726 RepID=UPI0025D2721F|nr:CvpA family protein [Sulfurovum sp.]